MTPWSKPGFGPLVECGHVPRRQVRGARSYCPSPLSWFCGQLHQLHQLDRALALAKYPSYFFAVVAVPHARHQRTGSLLGDSSEAKRITSSIRRVLDTGVASMRIYDVKVVLGCKGPIGAYYKYTNRQGSKARIAAHNSLHVLTLASLRST